MAYGIFRAGNSLIGKTIGAAGEHLTGSGIAAQMSAALGQEVRYRPVPPEVFRSFGFPGADDLGNMFQYYQEFERELAEVRSVERSRALNPQLQNFAEWLRDNARLIPIEQVAS